MTWSEETIYLGLCRKGAASAEDLSRTEPELKDPIDQLVAVQRDEAAAARKGWKRGLKEGDGRWRSWHT